MALSSSSGDDGVISGINVTPLVDITLVLLIIFMVTASVIVSNSIPVDLPQAATGEEVTSTVVLSIDENGGFHLDGVAMSSEQILRELQRARQQNAETRAIVSADRRIPHARFVTAVDIVRRAGISRFAIDVDQRLGSEDSPELAQVAR
jgi:biopolymer transport protein ExbD